MENTETKENLPILVLLEENKKIVVLNTEHDAILNHIEDELKANKYNSIVTEDNLDAMKESSKELGKISESISRFRIDKKDSEMEEINLFDKNLKSYCTLIDAKQTEIKKCLEPFEEKTRKQILEVCTKYLVEQYKEKALRVEFRIIDISDMTLSKYATKTMSIAKPAKDEIDKRINEKLALQNKVDLRLSNLENICLKAGIEPLTIEHVQGFLFETDERYETKLKVLIDAEIKRSEVAKIKVQAETRKAVAEEKTPFDDCPPPQDSEIIKYASCGSYQELEQPIKKEAPVVAEDGKIEKTLSIKISVPQKATNKQIINAVINMIKADTLPVENIEVR